MTLGSAFLLNLNAGDETPGTTFYLTIIGKNSKSIAPIAVCEDITQWHDGVVCSNSVPLNGANNKEFYNKTHSDLIYSSKSPEVYNTILDFL